MTTPPSAAVGKAERTGPRNRRVATTHVSATSEWSWERLPIMSPSAVRLPLLLTGNPWNREEPTFTRPSANSSWPLSIFWRWRAAKARDSTTLSE